MEAIKNGLEDRDEIPRPVFNTMIDYRSAVAEFDRLWESGATGREQQRMRELLELIEPFENGNSGAG